MAFTMAELRQELQALGYGALPDEFIVSSLSQLQLEMPQSWDSIGKGEKGGGSSSRQAGAAGKSAQQVHGPPVPGDQEFVAASKKSAICSEKDPRSNTVRNGGLGSIFLTADFATELDEMRKMLSIMQGTREELFGPTSASETSRKPIGLADEHELYVGSLLDQWRMVGRAIQSRRQQCAAVGIGILPNDAHIASNSETGRLNQLEQLHTTSVNSENRRRHRKNQQDTFLEAKTCFPVEEEPSISSKGLERGDDGIDRQAAGANMSAEAACSMGMVEPDLYHTQCHHEREVAASGSISAPDLNARNSNALKSGRALLEGNDTGLVVTKQLSSSPISLGVSYQQGGMHQLDNFALDAHNGQADLLNLKEEEIPPQSRQNAKFEDNPPSPRSSTQTPREVPDKLSAPSQDQFLAAFKKSLSDLDLQAKMNQNKSDATVSPKTTTVSRGHPLPQQPVVESENPSDLGGRPIVTRTPDRRSLCGALHFPLNDRSNICIAEEEEPDALSHSGAKPRKKTEFNSATALKRHPTATLKRSRSSRGASTPNEIGEEANNTNFSDIVHEAAGGQGDSHLLSENRTPPPSAGKLKLKRALSEKSINPRATVQNRGTVDASDPDISSLNFSPIRVGEQPVSPLNHLPGVQERPCFANEYPEHRLCSRCIACQPSLRRSGDSYSQSTTTSGSRSPFGKSNAETILGEAESSPQQQRPTVRREAWSLSKQKLLSKKSSAAPSGIYSPLLDSNKDNLDNDSKVLLKARRLASSMELAFDSSTVTDRRSPSLRSSTRSSRHLGPQRATSSQSQVSKSNSGSSPYAKSLSFGSRSSTPKDVLSSPFGKSSSFNSCLRSATPKDALTPGGPRRGGKVDRVARFAEMQNLWKNDKFLKTSMKRKPESFHRIFARLHLSHERCTAAYKERVLGDIRPATEQPPFVVPTLYSNSEGVCTF